MTAWPLGVVDVVFEPLGVVDAAQRAASLGFAHLDVIAKWTGDDGSLAVPVGDRMWSSPRPGFTVAAPLPGDGVWDATVTALRRTPRVRLEPWVGSICGSVETTKAMLAKVPGLRLLVDTGHVVCWGEDPVELLPWADHVQLRQSAPGRQQLMPDEGEVDFLAVFRALESLGYEGRLSIEYFNRPAYGWALDEPSAYPMALADHVRPLLG